MRWGWIAWAMAAGCGPVGVHVPEDAEDSGAATGTWWPTTGGSSGASSSGETTSGSGGSSGDDTGTTGAVGDTGTSGTTTSGGGGFITPPDASPWCHHKWLTCVDEEPIPPDWLLCDEPDVPMGRIEYQDAARYCACVGAGRAVPADFDNDGFDDVVAACEEAMFHFGNGTGDPFEQVEVALGEVPRIPVAADLDGDGWQDVAVLHGGNVSVLMNQTARSFAVRGPYPAPGGVDEAGAGDVDGDNDIDLLVTEEDPASATILLNDGTGQLGQGTMLDVGGMAWGTWVGDADDDGVPDVVFRLGLSIALYRGDGTGAFLAPVELAVTSHAQSVDAGDVDGDGLRDLVISTSPGISVAFGMGASVFALPVETSSVDTFGGMVLADLDGDQVLDMIGNTGEGIPVMVNDGTGAFTSVGMLPEFEAWGVNIGNFNNDARNDIMSWSGSSGATNSVLMIRLSVVP